MSNRTAAAAALWDVHKKEYQRGVFFEIAEATPIAERGRQLTGSGKGAAQKKRHCQSGKSALENAKLAKVFGQLNLGKFLVGINKA
jgi:hypothetical protein